METKVKKGWYPHQAPPGYLNDKTKDKGERDIYKDPERFALVKKMLETVAEGIFSPAEVLRKANEEWGLTTVKRKKTGGGAMSSTTFYRVLSNPFYYGYFEIKDKLYKGAHEPMITEEQFWHIQSLLGGKGRKRPRTREFAFTGMIKCGECGYSITAEEKPTKINKATGKPHVHYRCSKKNPKIKCKQGGIEVHVLEEAVDEFLATITISEDIKNWAIQYLHELNDEEAAINTHALEMLNKKYEDIQKRQYNLNTALIDGRFEDNMDEFEERKEALAKEFKEVKAKIDGVDQRTLKWLELSEKTFNFCCYARYWFNKGSTEDKKIILSTIGLNLVLKDKKLSIEPEELFPIVQNGVKSNNWRARRDSDPRPCGPEPHALSPELRAHNSYIILYLRLKHKKWAVT